MDTCGIRSTAAESISRLVDRDHSAIALPSVQIWSRLLRDDGYLAIELGRLDRIG